jgi:CHAT domain-containing protein
MSQQALDLLSVSHGSGDRNSVIDSLALQAIAHVRLHSFQEADSALGRAENMCAARQDPACGAVFRANGIFAVERGQLAVAKQFFQQSRVFARAHEDSFLEATALSNLGLIALTQEHFDEAKDQSDAAYDAAANIGATRIALVAKGNSGWASYRLGDSEKALSAFEEAKQQAEKLGDTFDEENEITNIGYIYFDQRKFDSAAQNFQQALQLAEGIKAKQDTYNVLRALARLELQTGDAEKADGYANQALAIARESGNHVNELYPVLVQGQVAARKGDAAKAQEIFESVEQDPVCPVFLKWETQHSLARLYEDLKETEIADGEFRAALTTFEAARAAVQREDLQLSFLTNAASIYDDYLHFLVAQGKTEEALRWADNSRARTLSEGLGVLANGAMRGEKKVAEFEPPVLNTRAVASHAKGVVLYYWLGEKQSYLWAITSREIKLFTLPAGPAVEARVQRYRQALAGPMDVLDSGDQDGRWLYLTLIAPAQSLLPKNTKVLVIPDGDLNNLNFETLIVPDPVAHYWIEDAVITDSSSLRLLSAFYSDKRKHNRRRMLLIGNSIAPNDEYSALPNAEAQMNSVARHFADQRQIFSGAEATPSAYAASHPEQFSHIHFVAHGIASRLSPLDSAIVLSRDPNEPDSFKLYARDIIRHPLQADLVTISACYGAGERAYSGEGLVGLAWAFLRAGAHDVIAGLWEVTDASTEQLMDRFYDGLDKGLEPNVALRLAKLSLLHGSAFHNPFYWASFQLYVGS